MAANWIVAAGVGLVAGLVASGVMNAYQAAAAPLFGQDDGNDDPATVQVADDASRAATGEPVTQKRRATAGALVHYATGAGLGVAYGVLAREWPPATAAFGIAYGLAVAVALDDVVVPAFGWGPAPWKTPLAGHAYGLSSHVVFGVALEGVRRGGLALLD